MKEKYKLAVARGDGIGPEIVGNSIKLLKQILRDLGETDLIEFLIVDIGEDGIQNYGVSLPQSSIDTIKDSDGLVLGPLNVGKYPVNDPGFPSPSGKIRKLFDLYANIRPSKSFGFRIKQGAKPFDIVIVRENTEGFYSDRNMYFGSGGFQPTKDVAMSMRVVTKRASDRIARNAMELSRKRRKLVTAVHKENVLKVTDGLFLECFNNIARDYSDVKTNSMIIDAMSYDLVKNPTKYDVIVTTNMYGDILSDEAAAIAGSLGLAPSLNAGDQFAMAQATHGSAPDIAGKNIANPLAIFLSIRMLLEWLGERNSDQKLKKISGIIAESAERLLDGNFELTPDLDGKGTTDSVTKDLGTILTKLVSK